MKSRIAVTLAVAIALLAGAPPVFAQEPHLDAAASGTTGLFTVPTSAVLGPKEFHAAAYFYGWQVEPGDSSIEYGGLSFAVAFAGAPRLEIFGTFEPRIGVHRNYTVEKAEGFVVNPAAVAPRLDDHPFATDRWGTGVGDLYVGGKYKVIGDTEAFDGVAVIAQVKLPTSDTDAGIGTGKLDFSIGVTASHEAAEKVGITGYGGGTFRSSPDEIALGNKFDFGVGVQVPTRFWISAIGELTGSIVSAPAAPSIGQPMAAGYDPVMLIGGMRLSHESGFAADLAWMFNLNVSYPDDLGIEEMRDNAGFIKVSYTNSRREPVVLMGAAPMALPPVNSPPTLTCRAERTSVRVGESVRLFADVNDPDGDDVTVTWATQAGTINPRQGEAVTWSSQGVNPGTGPVTARASDGYGGTSADCEITLTVTAPPPPAEPEILTFTCSEFPSGNTRIDNRCKAILDDVALQLRQNPSATAVITGHSDSAGAADVNAQMSTERADNAETYLVDTHGIDGGRIDTASAGSSEPIGDNATAEGRLQNRRIVVVVTIPAQ